MQKTLNNTEGQYNALPVWADTVHSLRPNALTQSVSLDVLHSLIAFFIEGSPALPFLFSLRARRKKRWSHRAEQPGLSDPMLAQILRAHSPCSTLIRWCVLHVRISAPHNTERLHPSVQIGVECCHQ